MQINLYNIFNEYILYLLKYIIIVYNTRFINLYLKSFFILYLINKF